MEVFIESTLLSYKLFQIYCTATIVLHQWTNVIVADSLISCLFDLIPYIYQ